MVNWQIQLNPLKTPSSQELDVVGSTTQKRSEVAEVINEVSKQFSSTFNPPVNQSNWSIENHSKCYKQLSDLKLAGVLKEE